MAVRLIKQDHRFAVLCRTNYCSGPQKLFSECWDGHVCWVGGWISFQYQGGWWFSRSVKRNDVIDIGKEEYRYLRERARRMNE